MSMPAGDAAGLGKLNVPVYRAHAAGGCSGKIGRAPVLLLTSTGRRSGQPRTAPVRVPRRRRAARRDRLQCRQRARARPGRYNLKANPDAEVQIGGERRRVRARVAEGEERAELWRRMNEQYAGFDDYEERTSRDIAVFVLEPR